MKTRHLFPLSTLVIAMSMSAAHAANDRYWDSDGTTAGGSANTVAVGTWGTSTNGRFSVASGATLAIGNSVNDTEPAR